MMRSASHAGADDGELRVSRALPVAAVTRHRWPIRTPGQAHHGIHLEEIALLAGNKHAREGHTAPDYSIDYESEIGTDATPSLEAAHGEPHDIMHDHSIDEPAGNVPNGPKEAPLSMPASVLSSLYFLLWCALYFILCVAVVFLGMRYSPLGWQGFSADHISSTPEMAAYVNDTRVQSAARLAHENLLIGSDPGQSIAVAKLRVWSMIAPPIPDLDEAVPVSPFNASSTIAATESVAPAPWSVNFPLGPEFVIVTYASAVYYDRLLNVIGSLQFWEPTQRIVVYDIGLTQAQVVDLQCTANLELRPFNFSIYPAHVLNLFQYYFKPLLLYDALQHASSVLLLDSGIELRQPLRSVKRLLERDGFFSAVQPNTVGRKTRAQTFQQLGVNQTDYMDVQFCAAAIIGFVRAAPSYSLVVEPAAQCALKPACHSPAGSGRSNHNFDQSTLTILLHKHGLRCARERKYREMEMARCPIAHDRYFDEADGGVVLCMRRWHMPKPYLPIAQRNPQCQAYMCTAPKEGENVEDPLDPRLPPSTCASRTSLLAAADPPAGEVDGGVESSWIYRIREWALVEHTQGSHLSGDSPMVACLARNHNYHPNCTEEIAQHEADMRNSRMRVEVQAGFDELRAVLFASTRMPATYLLCATMWAAVLLLAFGRDWTRKNALSLSAGWIILFAYFGWCVDRIDQRFD